MDMEPKNPRRLTAGKWPARIISLLLVAGLSAGLMGLGLYAYRQELEGRPPLYQQADFISNLYRYSYLLNWRLQQESRGNYNLTPAQLYFPALYENMPTATGGGGDASSLAGGGTDDMSGVYPASTADDSATSLPDDSGAADAPAGNDEPGANAAGYSVMDDPDFAINYDSLLQSVFSGMDDDFIDTWDGLEYIAYDESTGASYGNAGNRAAELAAAGADIPALALAQAMDDEYDFYAVLRFGPNGELSTPAYHGVEREDLNVLAQTDMEATLLNYVSYFADDYDYQRYHREMASLYRPPHGLTVVFSVPAGTIGQSFEQARYNAWSVEYSGFPFFVAAAVVLAALLGIMLALVRPLRLNQSVTWTRQPFEFSIGVLAVPLVVTVDSVLNSILAQVSAATMLDGLLPESFGPDLVAGLNYAFFWAILFGILWLTYTAAASLMQVRSLGLKRYFTEKCLIVVACRAIGRFFKRVFAWLSLIDLTEPGSKAIVKILAVNFVILAILCTVWVFGIALLVVYTIVLFIVMQRWYKNMKRQYGILLDALGKMAEGQLDVPIDEDLGLFEPMKQELQKVQHGFAHAVEAETRSQNMKTELVTNVSHDLKTPLTAIITYVDLLKNEDLTGEERREYVATLDRKSQRLKRLIEDLFEMSRAASRDIALNLQTVDLAALIRQVELEAEDELTAASIEFRNQFPQEKIELRLDGEKTSRIFENLVLNVAKYGMPGSRAYVTLKREDGAVEVEVKNVSREALDFEGKDITDRFVRGDASRSTEGSGLGLAIAKSFAEAQGGSFAILTDGDLFKARIRFPAKLAPPAE